MEHAFSRTELLLGEAALQRLQQARVAVFGVGGVGGYVVEALARSGVGALDLIDHDVVSLTNLNRQIIALHSTLGQEKVAVAKNRILDIAPSCQVRTYPVFYTPETADQFDFSAYDYVVDAIDSVTGKLELVRQANCCHTPIISSMGAGNKLDPTAFTVTDIYKTSGCHLARIMRKECRARGIRQLKVVYSTELPRRSGERQPAVDADGKRVRDIPGSISFVPGAAGLIAAGVVIRELCGVTL